MSNPFPLAVGSTTRGNRAERRARRQHDHRDGQRGRKHRAAKVLQSTGAVNSLRGNRKNLRRQPPHGFQEHRVVGCRLQLRLPDFLGARTFAFRPQHFAQVRRDLGIGAFGKRAA